MEGSTTPPRKTRSSGSGTAHSREDPCDRVCWLGNAYRESDLDLPRKPSHRDLRQRYSGLRLVKRRGNVTGTARLQGYPVIFKWGYIPRLFANSGCFHTIHMSWAVLRLQHVVLGVLAGRDRVPRGGFK
jgi:hypothetical protein